MIFCADKEFKSAFAKTQFSRYKDITNIMV